jgi:HNH endonuclease
MTVPPAVRERFWSRVAVGGAAECWLWNGAVNGGGYGGSSISGKPNGAHRIAWILTHGPIPDGLHVCHTCDTPRCCNVNHLFLGTQAENMADSARKGRTRKTPPEGSMP